MIKKIITLALAVAITAPAVGAKKLKYRNPTGKEFPILAWFSILGDSNLTKARYQELRNAGFNISFSHFSGAESLEKGLRACRGTGVKIMATCKELETNTTATVRRFKGDPAIVGWFLKDEPVTLQYPQLRQFRDSVVAADSKHLPYLNLLPSTVKAVDLHAESYEDYVQRFVDEVGLPLISYDQYPILEQNGEAVVRPEFYENLEIVSRVARRNGLPFWAFCLSTAHMSYPIPPSAHMRYEAFSALAYGAQCIQYFTYWTPLHTVWDFHAAPIDSTLRRNAVYYRVKEVNREIQALSRVFLGATADDVSFTGGDLPQGTKAFTRMPAKLLSLQTSGKGALVSQMHNGRRRYVVVVSRDISSAQTLTLQIGDDIKRVLSTGKEVALTVGRQDFNLPAGGYVILRTK